LSIYVQERDKELPTGEVEVRADVVGGGVDVKASPWLQCRPRRSVKASKVRDQCHDALQTSKVLSLEVQLASVYVLD
jgi:hypothetical protein